MEDLRFLSADALEGRATGSEGAAAAAAYIAAAFEGSGLEPLDGRFRHEFSWTPRGEPQERIGVNVLGALPGTDRGGRYIVLSAHYDHVGIRNGAIYNGADDNASGTVALLAIARALRGHPLRHTVLVSAFDGEELGLQGATAFVNDPPVSLDAIEVNLNMDMVARTDGILWAGGAYHTPALRPVLEEAAARSPVTLRLGHDRPGAPEGQDWSWSSDHGAFLREGIPFVYLGVEDHADYHRPTDDFENVDPGEYMAALRTALMTLLALDEALPLGQEGGS
jgi:Zn-dependent M28 family amino/carboxypeptidase